jgi:hypothetical protein
MNFGIERNSKGKKKNLNFGGFAGGGSWMNFREKIVDSYLVEYLNL